MVDMRMSFVHGQKMNRLERVAKLGIICWVARLIVALGMSLKVKFSDMIFPRLLTKVFTNMPGGDFFFRLFHAKNQKNPLQNASRSLAAVSRLP